MTLKEKFRQALTGHLSDEKTEVDINISEKIADDYAVEFAEWFIKSSCFHSLSYGDITVKQSLETFKKEKGYEFIIQTMGRTDDNI